MFRLDPDTKNSEILRLLPLLTPFANDFVGLRQKIDRAFSQLEDIENAKRNLLHNHNNNNNINNTINNINNNSLFSFHGDDASSYSYASKIMFISGKCRKCEVRNNKILDLNGHLRFLHSDIFQQLPSTKLIEVQKKIVLY